MKTLTIVLSHLEYDSLNISTSISTLFCHLRLNLILLGRGHANGICIDIENVEIFNK